MKDGELFDRSRLRLLDLSERVHDLDLGIVRPLAPISGKIDDGLAKVADRIVRARRVGAAVVLMMGGHVIRRGVQRYLIDLMERGLVSCLSCNGSCVIHDFELALIGATTESVARYVSSGQFGLWRETGRINDVVASGRREGLGLGEAVGREIHMGAYPHKDLSVFAAGYRLGVPVTVHVGIGCDIVHEHPNCDGAAYGETSYRDFLRFASQIENLENGVVMNFGSAVTAPEVYLKALSMARNAAKGSGKTIGRFATLVCDLQELPEGAALEPAKTHPAYFFRPLKTMLVRTVADGGESFYVRGDHADTIPALWTALGKAGPEGQAVSLSG